MNPLFRLKKDATPFFNQSFRAEIKDLTYWESNNISMLALEKVEPVFITYGYKQSDTSTWLSGWGNSKGENVAHFDFTLRFNGMAHDRYETFVNGDHVRGLMEKLQRATNEYLDDFYAMNE